MKPRRAKIMVAVVLLCMAGLFATLLVNREPRYEGRPLSEWVADLNGSDPKAHQKAVEVLREAGPEVIPYLVGEVDTRENWLRRTVKSIGRKFPEKIRAQGRKVFGTKQVMDRVAAAKALEVLGTNALEALPALTNTLRDPHVLLQQHASFALAKMPQAIPGLIQALDDGDFSIRTYACKALRAHGPAASNAVPRLIKILTNEVGGILSLASYTLSGIREPAIPQLTELLTYTNSRVRKLAIDSLAAMDVFAVPAVPALVGIAKDPDPDIREKVISAIGRIDRITPEADTALIEALGDTNQTVRALAIEALIFRARAVRKNFPVFEALLDDPNQKVREGAQTIVDQYREQIAQPNRAQP